MFSVELFIIIIAVIFEKQNKKLKNKCGMPKRKSKFAEELLQKYPFFAKGRDEFEAECITYGYGTFVSVANKDKLSLDMHEDGLKHKNAVRFTFFCLLA